MAELLYHLDHSTGGVSMTSEVIHLSPALKEIDPLLYARLESLNGTADRRQGEEPDGVLDDNDWETLKKIRRINDDERTFFVAQYNHDLSRWRKLDTDGRRLYRSGMSLAFTGDETGAREKWLSGRDGPSTDSAASPEVKIIFQEQLVWLDLFFGRWDQLAASISPLMDLAPDNAMALYASAYLAFRKGDDTAAKSAVDRVEASPEASPVLKADTESLEADILDRNPQWKPETPPVPNPLSADELAAWDSYVNYRVMREGERIRNLFAGTNFRNFNNIKNRLIELHLSGKLAPREIPWVCHALVRTVLKIDASPRPRTLKKAFARGVYDCSEHTEAVQDLLNAVGVKTRAVAFWLSEKTQHAFVMYQINDKWGYASVMSFSDPVYDSPRDILNAWEWTRYKKHDFSIGRLKNGRLKDVVVLPTTYAARR